MPSKFNSVILTCEAYPSGNAALQGLLGALRNLGSAESCVWQRLDSGNLARDSVILPLAVWDYSLAVEDFIAFVESAKARNLTLLNPPNTILWNLNKSYLLALESVGVAIIPSEIITKSEIVALQNNSDFLALIAQKAQSLGANNPVIKPLIGQSGRAVVRLAESPNVESYANGAIIQPFIECGGEVCCVFFNNVFQYAVKRVCDKAQWRANSAYNVKILPINAEKSWIQIAQNALEITSDLTREIPLYARVDMMINGAKILINEVELIEPSLYFDTQDSAIPRFVEALRVRL